MTIMANGNSEMDRPIILSPPPLDLSIPVGHSERQPSLGFNLQHEFETLTADLDLDLNHRQSISQSSRSKTLSSSGDLLVPQASRYGFGDMSSSSLLQDSNGTSGHNFLKGNSLFPAGHSMPERPQSVNDFSNFFGSHQPIAPQPLDQAPNFYLELIRYTNWINGLNPQESSTMVEYLANNASFDVLLSLRSKIESKLQMMQGGLQSSIQLGQSLPPSVHSVPPGMYGGPSSYSQNSDLVHDMEQVSLNSSSLSHMDGSNLAVHQPKPKSNPMRGGQLFEGGVRAKSAEPSINGKMPMSAGANPMDRTKSPTSHLYEKTNFLQLAAGNSASPNHQGGQLRSNNSDESLDMSQAALKLGALATINSRVALDSSKKNFLPNNYHRHHYMEGNDQNRAQNKMTKSPPNSKNKRPSNSPELSRSYGHSSDPGHVNLQMPLDVTNPELLENIPAWLKILRLHKYTDCLKDIHWRDLIEFDDAKLEAQGVKALGARTKLLKTFDAVKKRT